MPSLRVALRFEEAPGKRLPVSILVGLDPFDGLTLFALRRSHSEAQNPAGLCNPESGRLCNRIGNIHDADSNHTSQPAVSTS